MAFCTSCGSQMEGAFCTNCGAPAQPGAAQPAAAPPQSYPPASAAAGAPPTKKSSPWMWVLVGCLGLVVVGTAVIAIGGFFAAKKLKDFADNPAAAAELLARANPNVEVISSDSGSGKITLRDKTTGKVITLNFEDIKKGHISFEGDNGERVDISGDGKTGSMDIRSKEGTAHVGAGSAADIPSWVPQYPGSTPEGAFSSKNDKGEGGAFGFVTKDPVEKVANFYAQALESAGMKVDRHSMKVEGKDHAVITGKSDTTEVSVGINSEDEGTRVGLNYVKK